MRSLPILSGALLALSLAYQPVRAEDLGRLFFTPEQRAMLDLARRTQSTTAPSGDTGSDGVTLSGIVTRSDGRQTVWINGRPQPAGVATSRSPSSASIPLPGGGGQVRLRVGQTLDPSSGKVEEGYRRPRPAASPENKPAAPAEPGTQLPKPAKPATNNIDDDGNDEPAAGALGR